MYIKEHYKISFYLKLFNIFGWNILDKNHVLKIWIWVTLSTQFEVSIFETVLKKSG